MKDFFIVEGDRIYKKIKMQCHLFSIRKAILDEFQKYSSELPFSASGVFSLNKKMKDGYKVYLISPEIISRRKM